MSFTRQHPTHPFPFIHSHHPYHHSPKPFISLLSKTPKRFSLFATPPTSASSDSSSLIFLPFLQDEKLQEEEEDDVESPDDDNDEEEEEVEEDPEDPMMRFFKSRTADSIKDPQPEGKLSLQKNRRSSWHLAAGIESVEEPEIEFDAEKIVIEEKEQIDSASSGSSVLPEGVVGEIIQIARGLPENTTLGEVLGGFEESLGEKECVEVLGLMGEEGLLRGCLYFYEWMSLQEPSLVSSRACSILFPLLGRAGMGDELMVLFRNLPSKKEFRDVHVYNAAISGLLCSRRYGILGTPL